MGDTQLWYVSLLFYLAGYLGMILHVTLKAYKAGVRTLGETLAFIKNDTLATFLSVLTYNVIILLWYTDGFDLLNLHAGVLSGMTPFIAYGSNDIFRTAVAIRLKNKEGKEIVVESEENKP